MHSRAVTKCWKSWKRALDPFFSTVNSLSYYSVLDEVLGLPEGSFEDFQDTNFRYWFLTRPILKGSLDILFSLELPGDESLVRRRTP